uniref:Lipocalin/cytosolic fatty-acid binding domain-containing protein n=1 Tax=Graphocephala atropunctata TaxID=36148 RepID=A0A1B6LNG2_9HEMI
MEFLRVCFCIVLTIGFSHWGKAAKCDPEIIAKIEQLWNGNIPTNIIDNALNNGKEIVTRATLNYYLNGTTCVYSFFSKGATSNESRVFIAYVMENGNTTPRDLPIQEIDGTTYDPTTGTTRYHVCTEGGMTALYPCTVDGEEGDAKGLVKISYRETKNPNQAQYLIEKGVQCLASVGVYAVEELPLCCC